MLANQLMNRYLKNLCELAGFNKPIKRVCYRAGERVEETFPKYEMIGTHAGRRTFICFALSSGIPPQVVMKWTGLRLPGDEALYRDCREDQGGCHETL